MYINNSIVVSIVDNTYFRGDIFVSGYFSEDISMAGPYNTYYICVYIYIYSKNTASP